MDQPRIAVLGTGAQGAGIGADLIEAGHDVTFVEQWPAHVEAMRARGIEVRRPEGTRVTAIPAVHHLCEVAELREPFDVVLLVVKAYDTRWSTSLILPLLHERSLVVGIQNGMTLDDIAEIAGPGRALGAVIEMASNMFEPGIVTRQNSREETWFTVGAEDEGAQARAPEVRELLAHAGRAEVSGDIRSSKWMKLVANAGELVTSAILDLPLAEAARLPGVHEFMIACGAEAARAALSDGARLVPIFGLAEDRVTDPDRYAAELLGKVLETYSLPDTRTTILQDWMKGRHAEYREINGHVVDVLARAGIAAPYNARVVELARRIESGGLARGPQNRDLVLEGLRR